MAKSFLAKDYETFVNYVHPDILKIIGGRQKMMSTLKASLQTITDQGMAISNVSIGDPLPLLNSAAGLQCVVPQILELKTAEGKLVSTSYLIATSTDKGKTWHFIDTSNKTLAQLRQVIPSLSSQLEIPKRKEPVFYPDKE